MIGSTTVITNGMKTQSVEPCSCFNQWLERQTIRMRHLYANLSEKDLLRIVGAWNAGWNEGWQRRQFWLDKDEPMVELVKANARTKIHPELPDCESRRKAK